MGTPDDTTGPTGRALRDYFEATSGANDPTERAAVGRWVAGDDAVSAEAATERARLDAIWAAPPRRRRWLAPTLIAALAATLAIVVSWPEPTAPAWQVKGVARGADIALQLGVRRGGSAFVYGGDQALMTGDHIGLFFTTPRAGYLVVIYRDSEGAMVRLFPRGSERSVAVPAGREVRLDAGAILTPAHGCEHVIAVFGAEPFSAAEVGAELRATVRRQGCELSPMPTDGRLYQVVTIQR